MTKFSICRSVGAVMLLAAAAPVMAQNAAKAPTFEVVSIRPYQIPDGRTVISYQFRPDGIYASGISVKMLIQIAYDRPREEQILGAGGVGDKRFVIEAKMDADTMAVLAKLPPEERRAQQRLMLQAMLEDRFKLKAHSESKEMGLYEMVVAKGGPKMKEDLGGDPVDAKAAYAKLKPGDIRMGDHSSIVARAVSIDNLAYFLMTTLSEQVVDKTGLTGTYSFSVKWTPDDPSDPVPSILTAFQEQLGLKLNSTKGPADVVVVDHMEMPSEN